MPAIKLEVRTLQVRTLLEKGRYTLWQLERLTGSSQRSVLRDLDTLRRLGLNVQRARAEDGRGGLQEWWIA